MTKRCLENLGGTSKYMHYLKKTKALLPSVDVCQVLRMFRLWVIFHKQPFTGERKTVCLKMSKSGLITIINLFWEGSQITFPTIKAGEKWVQPQFSQWNFSRTKDCQCLQNRARRSCLLIREVSKPGRCSGPIKMLEVYIYSIQPSAYAQQQTGSDEQGGLNNSSLYS